MINSCFRWGQYSFCELPFSRCFSKQKSEQKNGASLLSVLLSTYREWNQSQKLWHFSIGVPSRVLQHLQCTLIFWVLIFFCLTLTSNGNIEKFPCSKQLMRWLWRRSWRNRILFGSWPQQSATAFATANRPQSSLPCCCCIGTLFAVPYVLSCCKIVQIWLVTSRSKSSFKLS